VLSDEPQEDTNKVKPEETLVEQPKVPANDRFKKVYEKKNQKVQNTKDTDVT